jgi:hypothetical protein
MWKQQEADMTDEVDPNAITWMSHPDIPHTRDTPVQVTEAQLAEVWSGEKGWVRTEPNAEQAAVHVFTPAPAVVPEPAAPKPALRTKPAGAGATEGN